MLTLNYTDAISNTLGPSNYTVKERKAITRENDVKDNDNEDDGEIAINDSRLLEDPNGDDAEGETSPTRRMANVAAAAGAFSALFTSSPERCSPDTLQPTADGAPSDLLISNSEGGAPEALQPVAKGSPNTFLLLSQKRGCSRSPPNQCKGCPQSHSHTVEGEGCL